MGPPGLTLASALVVGALARIVGRRTRVPSIALFLCAGVACGPGFLGWIDPAPVAGLMPTVIAFATAIILFEGGMGIDLKQLRHRSATVRRLVLVAAPLSGVGSALTARALLHWPWGLCALFGAIGCVTGPTVIAPLLDHVRVRRSLDTVLRTEGVLVDGLAAVTAAVLLEIVPTAHAAEPLELLWSLARGMGAGLGLGLMSGGALAYALRPGGTVARGDESAFTLAWVLGTFALANGLVDDSGLLAVTIAGATVGNLRPRKERALREFKGQLVTALIGMVFVLLAADASVEDALALGATPWLVAATLALVVRPASVLIACAGTRFPARERLFVSWMGPRGIIAAAVASLAAASLDASGEPGGAELRTVVFILIASTVTVQPLLSRVVAGYLGVLRRGPAGGRLLELAPEADAPAP